MQSVIYFYYPFEKEMLEYFTRLIHRVLYRNTRNEKREMNPSQISSTYYIILRKLYVKSLKIFLFLFYSSIALTKRLRKRSFKNVETSLLNGLSELAERKERRS